MSICKQTKVMVPQSTVGPRSCSLLATPHHCPLRKGRDCGVPAWKAVPRGPGMFCPRMSCQCPAHVPTLAPRPASWGPHHMAAHQN